MPRSDSQALTTMAQHARSPPTHPPYNIATGGNQIAIMLTTPQSNQRHTNHEHGMRAHRGTGLGSTGRSRDRHQPTTTSFTPTFQRDMQKGLDNNESIIIAEYENIAASGAGTMINGSIGVPQIGKWSGIKTELRGGVMLNGGIRNTTKDDVEALKVITGPRKSGRDSSKETEPGCCVIL